MSNYPSPIIKVKDGDEAVEFSAMEYLGSGAYGAVYRYAPVGWKLLRKLANGTAIENVAVKILPHSEPSAKEKDSAKERRLLEMDHKNVVKILAIDTQAATSLTPRRTLICMEYCPGGDLSKLLADGLCWTLMVEYAAQVLEGLAYLHDRQGMIHGDIKPQNILVKDLHSTGIYQTVKVGDMDDIVPLKDKFTRLTDVSRARGTRPYFSPEMMAKERGDTVKVGRRTDIWSFGCVLHQMVYGCNAVGAKGVEQSVGSSVSSALGSFVGTGSRHNWVEEHAKSTGFKYCRKDELDRREHQGVPKWLEKILDNCFEIHPERRAFASTLRGDLKKPEARNLQSLLMGRDAPQFDSSMEHPSSYKLGCGSSDMLTVWQGAKEASPFGPNENVQSDVKLQEFLKADLPLSLKLLVKQVPIALHIAPENGIFPSPFRFAPLADKIVWMRLWGIEEFPANSLPEVFLPNLVVLELWACKGVTVTRTCLHRYPRLQCFGLDHCTIISLERNFLANLPSLKHFSFAPLLAPQNCKRRENRTPEENVNQGTYAWLNSFLTQNPALTRSRKLLYARKILKDSAPYSSTAMSACFAGIDPEAVQHTLECLHCSEFAYEGREQVLLRATEKIEYKGPDITVNPEDNDFERNRDGDHRSIGPEDLHPGLLQELERRSRRFGKSMRDVLVDALTKLGPK